MKRRVSPKDVVIHPLLFAAFPVIFLYRRNVANVPAGDLVNPLLIILGATIVFLAIAWLLLRNIARAGLVTTIAVFVVFAYGSVYPAVKDQSLGGWIWGRHRLMVPLWCLLGTTLAFVAVRASKRLDDTTRVLNIVAAVLLATVLIPIGGAAFQGPAQAAVEASSRVEAPVELRIPAGSQAAVEASSRVEAPVELRIPAGTKKPDIYYVILDRYAGVDTLRSSFRYDNSAFLATLRTRGFYVADSWANYPRTTHSLAASLNMQYLDGVTSETGRACSWGTLFGLLNGHKVARTLKAIGYRYVEIGSWWKHTAHDPLADVIQTPKAPSEFARTLYQTTLPAALGQTSVPALDWGRQYWRVTRAQFDRLESGASMKEPRFVFAHILLPHEPWVFEADGSFLPRGVSVGRTPEVNYLGQLRYTNTRILRLLDKLLAGPEESRPVIILQSDEGTFPRRATIEGDGFRWDKATPKELQVKMNILNAYYWPGVRQTGLYRSITPVNSFRLLFEKYFAADLPLLPDRVGAWEDGRHPCRLHDVTKRVNLLRTAPEKASD